MNYLLILLGYLVLGAIFCTIIATIAPRRFIYENEFRVALAGWVLILWLPAVSYALVAVLLWPAKKLVQRALKASE